MSLELRDEFGKEFKDHYAPAGTIMEDAEVMVKANVEFLLDLMFRELGSRTCENCKHLGTETYQTHRNSVCYILQIDIYDKDFGCNKFERKEDD